MPRPDLVTLGLLVLGLRPLAAQDRVQFRFEPELGRVVRTLTEIRTSTTLTGFPAVPDGAVLEDEAWISATQRVTALAPQGAVVEVTVDSIRGRLRLGDDPWRDHADSTLIGRSAEAILSPRFGVVGLRSAGPTDGEVLQTLGAYAAGLGFAFPDGPVAVGETFATGGRLRTRVATGRLTGLEIDEVAFGDLVLTLDSVVGTPEAALGYLHFQGTLTPRSAATEGESGGVAVALSGGFAGRLVWSAAWGAFVSGALRVRVTGQVRVDGPGGADSAEATWDRTVVHRVRP